MGQCSGFEFEWQLLVDEFGIDIAQRVVDLFAGMSIYFPKSHTRIVTEKNVHRLHGAGKGVKEIAQHTKLSTTHVRHILRKMNSH